ncbi:MAG: peptidyl-prolyl cis-trans isomerase SurA [Granulosicoccus sp.]|jgi:peptidyl-prolyl cis-trans isomerase SurA
MAMNNGRQLIVKTKSNIILLLMCTYKTMKMLTTILLNTYLLLFTLLSSNAVFANKNIDSVIAIVKDDIIFAQELEQKTQQARVRLQARNKRVSETKLREQLLDTLIIEKLQLSLARQNNLQITDTEIDATLVRTKAQLTRNKVSFTEYLESQNLSETQAREEIRKELLISQVQKGVISQRINITEREVDNFLESKEGQEWLTPRFHVGQIFFPYTEKNKSQVMEKTKKLHNIVKKQPDNFKAFAQQYSQGPNAKKGGDIGIQRKQDLPPLFAERVINMKPGDITTPFFSGAGVHILMLFDRKGAEPVIVTQYKVQHILIKPTNLFTNEEAQEKINKLRSKIINGANFTQTAQESSDDLGSKLDGGDLGWSSPGGFVPVFEQVMKSTPIDAISQPFKSKFGWHILTVEDKRTKDIFDDVKRSQVRNIIGQQRFQDELTIWLKELRDSAYVEILI